MAAKTACAEASVRHNAGRPKSMNGGRSARGSPEANWIETNPAARRTQPMHPIEVAVRRAADRNNVDATEYTTIIAVAAVAMSSVVAGLVMASAVSTTL
jgi:hypothetical protein